MSVVLNVPFVGFSENCGFSSVPVSINLSLVVLLVNTHFSDYVKIRFISQLINDMFSVQQQLLKYFNGTTISASLSVLLPSNFPVILVLQSKDTESLIE